jgi:hypothetical protein
VDLGFGRHADTHEQAKRFGDDIAPFGRLGDWWPPAGEHCFQLGLGTDPVTLIS